MSEREEQEEQEKVIYGIDMRKPCNTAHGRKDGKFLTRCVVIALSAGLILTNMTPVRAYVGDIGESCDEISQLQDCIDLTCINSTCQICTTDEECQRGDDTGYQVCKDNECRTKQIFVDFLWQDSVTTCLIFVCGMLAAGAGIGGGGLYVPIFLMLGWGKSAVVRSLASTCGLALALFFLVIFQRHPEADRPAVDYRTMLVLEPIVLLGTIPGKILNELLPPVIIYVLLLVLLIVITVRSWQKYFKFKARDKKRLAHLNNNQEQLDAEDPAGGELELSDIGSITKGVEGKEKKTFDDGFVRRATERMSWSPNTRKKKKIKRQMTEMKESMSFPRRAICLLVLCWVLLLVIATTVKLGTDCNSATFWGLHAAYIPVLWSFSIGYGIVMGKKHERKVDMGYAWVDGDILWTKTRIVWYPLMFFFAGLMASLLGIGGGMVIAPLLLEIGMHPSVANATTGVMTLFTASSATIQYLLQDMETYDYFLWYMTVAFVAGLIGRFVINDYIKKTGKQAIAVFFLAILISGACALTVYVAIDRIVSDVQNHVPIELSEFCSAEK